MPLITEPRPHFDTLPKAATLSIIPWPKSVNYGVGNFQVLPSTKIFASPGAAEVAKAFAERLTTATGIPFCVSDGFYEAVSCITFELSDSTAASGSEGYRLTVNQNFIQITASAEAGLFYGLQTLLQLLPSAILSDVPQLDIEWIVPSVEIDDIPRFSWRGAMLDVSRHFMPLEFLRKFIDALALHKINVLQLHLTDDQGWRIEIKKYPKLTQIGAVRRHTMIGLADTNPSREDFNPHDQLLDDQQHAGYYTQADLRDLVAYAAQRHITIVPEIEMPGHATAAIAAYPEFGCTEQPLEVSPFWGIHDVLFNPSEETLTFLQNILSEVIDVFPSTYIHIGGDEAVKNQWRKSEFCQARMAELGLSDEGELQSYLVGRINSFVTSRGRKLVGWEEIIEGGLAPGSVVMSWRGESSGITAAQEGHDVVMAPYEHTYLDYYQSEDHAGEPLAFPSTVTLKQIYAYEPIPAELSKQHTARILGAQAQLWTEYMPHSKQVEYMAFPRLCALAEITWSDKGQSDYEDFRVRLLVHFERLTALGINYRAGLK